VKLKHGGILKGPMPYGITWRLMLLKVLHKPPRPIRIFIPKSKGKGDNHNKEIIVKLKHEGILKGPMPYGITWRLILLKVLHKPSRRIKIFIPKSKGKGDNHNNIVNVNDMKGKSK
jgi:hypothetical protein